MRRLLLTLAALAGLLLLAVPPAAAHGDVTGGSPAPGAALAPGTTLLRVDFSGLNGEAPVALALYDDRDRPLRVGDAAAVGSSLCARTEVLDPGVHTVAYLATGGDGHPVEGRYEFEVARGGEKSDAGSCDAGALAAPEEARTLEDASSGGLPGWAPWAVGTVAVVGAAAVAGRVRHDRRPDRDARPGSAR